jgi:hypothetical protein
MTVKSMRSLRLKRIKSNLNIDTQSAELYLFNL